ncbi:hypothetical protein WJX72_004011 [[Myrmecia] bisecta]|uniref:Pterin-binding domain-containing protein n=1 Tax=[Myrmecia] bisecta TaxID=41462 RepID=A0AAW1Q5Z4_9CHLO
MAALTRSHTSRVAQAPICSSASHRNTYTAAIAFGANIGDRLANIQAALQLLPQHGVEILRYSRLYESDAAYVTEQPAFLNGAVAASTELSPKDLLAALKDIEARLGRSFHGQRWGPRPIDLDIIFYGGLSMQDELLEVPHARWAERSFVTAPLADLYSARELPCQQPGLAGMLERVHQVRSMPGHPGADDVGLRCVLPLPSNRLWQWQDRTAVMGILNVTPDSFSGDGQVDSIDSVVARARGMLADGADILDVGGQSTRPGAQLLSPQAEARRVIPVISALQADLETKDAVLSVDTFHSCVAAEAVAAGAHMVNDVSGGRMDPNMFAEVARLRVPYILMHMRGTPATMQSRENTSYASVCEDVGRELQSQAVQAIAAGIEPWRIITDPGIGFAKTAAGNLELIAGLQRVREQLSGPLHQMPMLVGPSRKGFLGKLTGHKVAAERDHATAAAAALCVAAGASIVRAHNVRAVYDAVRVADAVKGASTSAAFAASS